jgi:undecaprenyl-diphosphatase
VKRATGDKLTGTTRRAYGWLRQNVDLFMLLVLAIIVVTAWLTAELADEVQEGTTQRYDEWVLHQLRTPGDITDPIGPAWFEDMWRDVTALGSPMVLTLVTLICAGYLLLRRRYRMLALLAVATVGGLAASLLLKSLFARPRPQFAAPDAYVLTASFPSGHSLLSAVVYLTLGALLARTTTRYRYKVYFITVALVVTVLVGFSRMYLGVHYPTDVLGGWSFGLLWALLCWLVARFLQKRGTIERPGEST